jgi:hypothetical protein
LSAIAVSIALAEGYERLLKNQQVYSKSLAKSLLVKLSIKVL